MNRFLLCSLMWLGLAVTMPTQASVLNELGQSLLSGSAPVTDPYSELPVSLLGLYARQEQNAFAGSAALQPQNGNKPGFFLMPVGRSDEPGVGLGVRFPF